MPDRFYVIIHPSGNIIGRLAGANPSLKPVMTGSHYDSVACGGAYDGIYGAIASIEVLRSFRDDGFIPVRTIEVIAFWEEEGAYYNTNGTPQRCYANSCKYY